MNNFGVKPPKCCSKRYAFLSRRFGTDVEQKNGGFQPQKGKKKAAQKSMGFCAGIVQGMIVRVMFKSKEVNRKIVKVT